MLNMWNNKNKQDNVVTIGINNDSDYKAENIIYGDKTTFDCNGYSYDVLVGGEAFVYNALSGIAIGTLCGLTKEQIKEGIKAFELTKNRLQIIKNNGYTIINDCYNANFDSMKEGISNLSKMEGKRKIAVLGDMLELGEYTEELHRNVGKEVVKNNIDLLITIGKDSKYIADEAKESINTFEFDNNKEAIKFLKDNIKKDDVILVKASNGMHFIEIVDSLKGE
jgi:UDP-N-acetylmuramoyl-tripeptide--D-alanyl-D-alanine ligase